MKAQSFTTRLIQLNKYLQFFPLDLPGQLVTSLPDNDIKEILYHTMPNMWEKKMVEQGQNYLDGLIHSMAKIFEIMFENLEKINPTKCSLKKQENKEKRVQEKESSDIR